MLAHLRNVHNVAPYECRCGVSFESIDVALGHSKSVRSSSSSDETIMDAAAVSGCSPNDLIVNLTPIYHNSRNGKDASLSPSGSRSDNSSDSGVQADIDDLEATDMETSPFRMEDIERKNSTEENGRWSK